MTSQRVRIRIQQRDGTCPTPDEACAPTERNVPFPRARNVEVYVVNDDGTETRLRNVKSVSFEAGGGPDGAVITTLKLFGLVLDAEFPVTNVFPSDDGEFLGEHWKKMDLQTKVQFAYEFLQSQSPSDYIA